MCKKSSVYIISSIKENRDKKKWLVSHSSPLPHLHYLLWRRKKNCSADSRSIPIEMNTNSSALGLFHRHSASICADERSEHLRVQHDVVDKAVHQFCFLSPDGSRWRMLQGSCGDWTHFKNKADLKNTLRHHRWKKAARYSLQICTPRVQLYSKSVLKND